MFSVFLWPFLNLPFFKYKEKNLFILIDCFKAHRSINPANFTKSIEILITQILSIVVIHDSIIEVKSNRWKPTNYHKNIDFIYGAEYKYLVIVEFYLCIFIKISVFAVWLNWTSTLDRFIIISIYG